MDMLKASTTIDRNDISNPFGYRNRSLSTLFWPGEVCHGLAEPMLAAERATCLSTSMLTRSRLLSGGYSPMRRWVGDARFPVKKRNIFARKNAYLTMICKCIFELGMQLRSIRTKGQLLAALKQQPVERIVPCQSYSGIGDQGLWSTIVATSPSSLPRKHLYGGGMNFVSATTPRNILRERLSLAWQFGIVGALVLVLGMTLIGLWVTSRIEGAAVRNAAGATALYVDSIIAPLTQELASATSLGDGAKRALTETLQQGVLSGRLYSFKIWRPDGTVLFSSEPSLVGKHFGMTDGLAAALSGSLHAELDDLKGEENLLEQKSGQPLLEIYSPIREPWSGDIIAVAEFYEIASDLRADLAVARLQSWLVVGTVTAGMLALLFGIVARGSHLIEVQRRSLDAQVIELSRMLDLNRALRQRADKANQRTATLNERYLRRISAELHDGPAQLLGFAALRLEAIGKGTAKDDDESLVSSSITEAIQEIRNICRDLTLPELEPLRGGDVVRRAIQAHESYSRTKIKSDVGALDIASQASKICAYRFIQEALSNATRHAGATQISLTAVEDAQGIRISVADNGNGFVRSGEERGLGLAGLEERLAGLGGRLDITSHAGNGTTVQMTLPRRSSE
jgi:signal transduction histidine kinase